MKSLKRLLDRARPAFGPKGRFHAFHSIFEGIDTFLFTPRDTAPGHLSTHIHDAMDSKRTMTIVIVALLPCLIFGMYNTGYQHWLAAGETIFPFWSLLWYGFLSILPTIVVTYAVGLGIEFFVAQYRHEEIQEGFLVTGLLIPMIIPVSTPLWMVAVATAFSVIFAKEVFGGTGYNIFNPALVARAFLFFSYPSQMSGDAVFVATNQPFGFGPAVADGFTCATPLGQIATSTSDTLSVVGIDSHAISSWDVFIGLIPGSFGETSCLCILIGAAILLFTRIASWRIILSATIGSVGTAYLIHAFANTTYPATMLNPIDQLTLGGLAFAIIFMATDPVTSCRTNTGKWIFGFLVGTIAIIIRTFNNGYPEGAMLAVLLMNAFAPLIDYCVVRANINRRQHRLKLAGSDKS